MWNVSKHKTCTHWTTHLSNKPSHFYFFNVVSLDTHLTIQTNTRLELVIPFESSPEPPPPPPPPHTQKTRLLWKRFGYGCLISCSGLGVYEWKNRRKHPLHTPICTGMQSNGHLCHLNAMHAHMNTHWWLQNVNMSLSWIYECVCH